MITKLLLVFFAVAEFHVPQSRPQSPPQSWSCSNEMEIWCTAESCSVEAGDDITPMSISIGQNNRLSVCAYTGCWNGTAMFAAAQGQLLWVVRNARFSSIPTDEHDTDLALLINERDGIGFVRAGGIATPVLCHAD